MHKASSVSVAEYAPHVSYGVNAYLRGNNDLARRIASHGVVPQGGLHFSSAIPQRMQVSPGPLAPSR